MRIFVDADACPVKGEAETVARRHRLRLLLVCNGGIRPSADPLVELVIVDAGPDAADIWIAETIEPGEICVTADLPLAERCVGKGARVLTHDGEVLDAKNIGGRVATRDLMADLRAADPFFQGKGRSFTKRDRSRFLEALDRLVRAELRARAKG